MESSEDDAGIATNASRRETARENDTVLNEQVNAATTEYQETSGGNTKSCESSIPEDSFDGESVSSPSAQDVNTSTEAILDMIDEFVDGPDAPKRLPLRQDLYENEQQFTDHQSQSNIAEKQRLASVENAESVSQSKQSFESCELTEKLEASTSIAVPEESSQVSLQVESNTSQLENSNITQTECSSGEPLPNVAEPHIESTTSTQSQVVPLSSEVKSVVVESSVIPETECNSVQSEQENSTPVLQDSSKLEVDKLQPPPVVCPKETESIETPFLDSCTGQLPAEDHQLPAEVDQLPAEDASQKSEILSECKSTQANPEVSTLEVGSSGLPTTDCSTATSVAAETEISNEQSRTESQSEIRIPLIESTSNVEHSSAQSIPDEVSNQSESGELQADCRNTENELNIDKPDTIRSIESSTIPIQLLSTQSTSQVESSNTVPETNSNQLNTETAAVDCSSVKSTVEERGGLNKPEPESRSIPSPVQSSVGGDNNQVEAVLCELPTSESVDAEPSVDSQLKNIPVNSASESAQNTPDISECSNSNRTVKQVTSSDIRDNVTVESAESTSSDISVSEVKTVCAEPVVRSHLRRRLVRPAPSDRRPDNTVSSTVDSQTSNAFVNEVSRECVVKDVSSSSDAVPAVHGKVNEEEIRNVSEISVCKAETSVSPPKKIKLNRQKPTSVNNSGNESVRQQSSLERDQPSTSSDSSQQVQPNVKSLNCISTSELIANEDCSSNKPSEIITDSVCESKPEILMPESSRDVNEVLPISAPIVENEEKKVPPIKLNLTLTNCVQVLSKDEEESNSAIENDDEDTTKQVPKLTIKLSNKQSEEMKSPIPRLTIKALKPPTNEGEIVESEKEQIPFVTKINIKPIPRAPEKVNEIHRKSSSSEISESECSENDESNSNSDQASVSDRGPSDVVPKVTIKLGKPGTESEGKFYTEQNAPKLTIKNIQSEKEDNDSVSKLKLVISQDEPLEKIPKLTIKNVKSEGQPLSPKLTIKPLKPPDSNTLKDTVVSQCETPQIPKLKISSESICSSEVKENAHVPKITIKPVIKPDLESISKSPKKSPVVCDSPDNIPLVMKLNIKPVIKPESEECNETIEVPVISKLNIKPIVKPNDLTDKEEVPKVTKLNIKPLKEPEESTSTRENTDPIIPVVTKINIKPIVKPPEEELKDSDNQSSETGNSSDDNNDQIPVVTKLNIKPVVKPNESNESVESDIPVVTKLNIKPIIRPEENLAPMSPKKDTHTVTKLNIKPVLKPEELVVHKLEEIENLPIKKPPLLMKINMKAMNEASKEASNIEKKETSSFSNHIEENIPVVTKINIKPILNPLDSENSPQHSPKHSPKNVTINCKSNAIDEINDQKPKRVSPRVREPTTEITSKQSSDLKITISKVENKDGSKELKHSPNVSSEITIVNCAVSHKPEPERETEVSKITHGHVEKTKPSVSESNIVSTKQTNIMQNCTLLKKLLESNKDGIGKEIQSKTDSTDTSCNKIDIETSKKGLPNCDKPVTEKSESVSKPESMQVENVKKIVNDSVTKPLEISISDKPINQSSGLDSPRIILKINKTDQGPAAKIVTEELLVKTEQQNKVNEIKKEVEKDAKIETKNTINTRRRGLVDTPTETVGKRLRSSRIPQVEKTPVAGTPQPEKTPGARRGPGRKPQQAAESVSPGKRTHNAEAVSPKIKEPEEIKTETPTPKEPELSLLETKRLKLEELLSKKTLTITPVPKKEENISPPKKEANKDTKTNHPLLNNENCSKNGNSKLHNILSSLQAQQIQVIPIKNTNCNDKNQSSFDLDCNTSGGSSDIMEIELTPIENCHHNNPEMVITEISITDSQESTNQQDEVSQDPLEVDSSKVKIEVEIESIDIPKVVEMTPTPKKRGRPRKIPLPEGAVPKPVVLPTPALEERPQRSLRLSRERPPIVPKPRGRGRGRGRWAHRHLSKTPPPEPEPIVETANKFFSENEKTPEEIDPTSSRIKLPRMTEALDKMPSVCSTPLSSRRRESSSSDTSKLFSETSQDVKVVLDPLDDSFQMKSPESVGSVGKRGRGGGRGRGKTPKLTPRNSRGRARGGGRGAMYMKETMGIYGRVCGPATTTVQLFEEETCMMDDNATPAKPSHLLDEDSQSSVKSSTNDSSKLKKSKFADLFDSNKVWTAADVKEYMWPPPEKPDIDHRVMMIQEQVAMFLGVKSFKRRYPELKRRPIVGEEREYVLARGLVSEAFCDLGVTAVDASEVLDIMLSDYPHKYEEYRSHQKIKQLTEVAEETNDSKSGIKVEKEVKESKPEPPKVDPEKLRQEMAAAAIASASEFNSRLNSARAPACVDLCSMTIQVRRPQPAPPAIHCRPPAGFYPHALLPGQYRNWYQEYTSQQLRCLPINTVLEAPPRVEDPIPDSSDSEGEWGSGSSCSDDSEPSATPAKRKKISKVKRSSQADLALSKDTKEDIKEEVVELCRVCKMREEGNRKYFHERFLSCSHCNAKLHPACVELSADTIRKCREYPWQCAECKSCCACRKPQDDDKMLFCDLCDRGFHIYCVGLPNVPSGRWHCAECAICKSCGARDPNGIQPGATDPTPGTSTPSTPMGTITVPGGVEWHHHTKRGPGGHKVYSHSLCTPCARAYRIGRYCPLCDRSFIGPKGTMQLVICKLCDRQHHQDCVRQHVNNLNVLDYTCAECRRSGITSRAAAVRVAPRTIATLFMAKRRFNKYAHRQYMQSRISDLNKTSENSETSNDIADDTNEAIIPDESCDRIETVDEVVSDEEMEEQPEASDPLEGVGENVVEDETAAAVEALQMNFG